MANKIILKKTSTASKVPLSTDLEVGEIAVNLADQKLYSKNAGGTVVLVGQGTGGSGDVVGGASSTDNALTRYDGTTGKLIQNSTVILDDNGNLSNVNSVGFDTTPTTPPTTQGSMYWDSGNLTPTVVLNANTDLQLGQENIALVYNGTGSTITAGSVVAVSGAQGQRPSVSLADADSEALSASTLGIATESIANGAEGFVTTFGFVRGINTSAFTAGAPIYLSQTAGQFTATRPSAPAHTVALGWVIKVNASSGEVFVNINNGWELDELHNVLITSPTSGNTLIYDAIAGVWENANITGGTGLSVTNGAGTIALANTGVTSAVAGTGIGVSGATGAVTITNTAPDQTVALTAGTGISTSGTYPNFTITNTGAVYDASTASTGFFALPVGTTAQRPVSPANGYTRINTTLGVIECYISGVWKIVSAFTAPNAPTIGTATATGSTTASVTYTAPANDGGSPITSYTAVSSPSGITATVTQSGSGTINVTGLTTGTAYTFTVYATNLGGNSASSSASNSITTWSVPNAPTIGTATATSATTATVTYTAPAFNGGTAITSYTAISTPSNITGTVSQAGSGTITVSGLTENTAYTFKVYATNAVGNSAQSSASNSITTPFGNYTVEYLSVAGGGGGGSYGGGAGAGGYISSSFTAIKGTGYTATVGGGGAGATSHGSYGGNGGNSQFAGGTTSVGGGAGGKYAGAGLSGGSGGGGGGDGGLTAGGSGTSGQGNSGGTGSDAYRRAGGGGGAGASGTSGNSTPNGGIGSQWLNGTYYAGGGGGGGINGGGAGAGGTGGGGAGTYGDPAPSPAGSGTANTGGGGGGKGGGGSGSGGAGGSGVVIVRYLSAVQKGSGGTVTSSGGYYYHTFTSSGTFTA